MKKRKIGIIGSNALPYGISLISFFKNAELISIFDSNKEGLNQSISLAKEKGIYIKSYNNADDFYHTAPDMIIADSNMLDYVFCENLFLTGIPQDSPCEGAGAQSQGDLYFFIDNTWVKADISTLSIQNQLDYIKSGKEPLFAYFMIKYSKGD